VIISLHIYFGLVSPSLLGVIRRVLVVDLDYLHDLEVLFSHVWIPFSNRGVGGLASTHLLLGGLGGQRQSLDPP
jgi:hypothetical protein